MRNWIGINNKFMNQEKIEYFNKKENNLDITRKDFFDFENLDNNGKWIRLETKDESGVEGTFYEAKAGNGKTVLFFPGLPGDIISVFEKDYVDLLLKNGYSVFCARHEGLIYSKENSRYINNNKKIELSNDENSKASISHWLNEPQVAIDYFSKNSKIIMITHSFSSISGAMSLINAEKEKDNSFNNLEKWLILSGSVWEMDNNNLDKNKGLTKDALEEYIKHLKDNKIFDFQDDYSKQVQELVSKLKDINDQISTSIPENLDIIGVYPKEDELVSPEIGESFFDKLPKGLLIQDQKAYKTNPHDYIHANPESLLRLINLKTKNKHNFIVNEMNNKKYE